LSQSRSEIAIVGGGITGASAAYHLAQAGRQVTLLERGEIASEASGVNAGSIGALGWGRLPDLQAWLTMGSLEIFRSLELDQGYDIEFRQAGALQAIQTEAQFEFARDQVLALRGEGYTVELLTIREARSLEPGLAPDLLGAVHSPLRSQADPVKATRALAHAAERAGAQILTDEDVTAIEVGASGGYRLVTSRGAHAADGLIIAAGAWCGPVGRMLGLSIPVVPVRGQMWSTEPLPPRVFRVISSTESSLHWQREPGGDDETPPELTHRDGVRVTRHLYGRQIRSGEIIFGGDREAVSGDGTPDPAGVEANFAHAAEVLPFLREVPVRRSWGGFMPFSLDGEAIIGRIDDLPHCYVVTGLGSSGFGRGPMAGRLIAEYVHTGHRHPALAEADPARCVTRVLDSPAPRPRPPRTRPARSGPPRRYR
jgi:glycine/D-amino acid oxidase-like deaminating enzyme